MTLSENIRACVAAMRKIEASATPAPWHFAGPDIRREEDQDLLVMQESPVPYGGPLKPHEDMRLIVTTRNALAASLGVMELVAEDLERHARWCPIRHANDSDTCDHEPCCCDLKRRTTSWCAAVRDAIEVKNA